MLNLDLKKNWETTKSCVDLKNVWEFLKITLKNMGKCRRILNQLPKF